jgi:hypothetical protein
MQGYKRAAKQGTSFVHCVSVLTAHLHQVAQWSARFTRSEGVVWTAQAVVWAALVMDSRASLGTESQIDDSTLGKPPNRVLGSWRNAVCELDSGFS